MGGRLLPRSILANIDVKCSNDDEKMSALINYVVTIIPSITWEKIAAALYEEDEEKAVERVKPYLHILSGWSCFNTAHTLNTYFHIVAQTYKVYLIVITPR